MVITYCDICGQRIDTKSENKFKLVCYKDLDEIPIYYNEDICEYCIDSINHHISELKQHKDGD